MRGGACGAVLSGAAGHGYGALDLFYLYKDADGPFPRNGFMTWRQAITYEGLPPDYYLRLTGAATRMIRGDAPLTEKVPEALPKLMD